MGWLILRLCLSITTRCAVSVLIQPERFVGAIWHPPHTHTQTGCTHIHAMQEHRLQRLLGRLPSRLCEGVAWLMLWLCWSVDQVCAEYGVFIYPVLGQLLEQLS